jgi:hypothetical protein
VTQAVVADLSRVARREHRALPLIGDGAPTPRQLFFLFAATLALRLIIVAIVLWRGHLSLYDFARLYDGRSYLITARAILGDSADFNDYHGRVFFGLPLTIATLARLGIPLHLSALWLNWIASSFAAVLAAKLFRDLRVGYATALLFPHALMNSCLTASESPMLALSLAGLLLMQRHDRVPLRTTLAGILLGLAMLFRPMACFSLVAAAFCEIADRRWRRVFVITLSAAAVFIAGMLLQSHFRHGDALANFRYQAHSPNAYAGQLLDAPFKALFVYPIAAKLPPARIAYVWVHAAVILLASVLAIVALLRRAPAGNHWLTTVSSIWLLANTAFILSLGAPWGFQCFHRFSIPAAPATWWFLRRTFPSGRLSWLWAPIAVTSMTISILTIISEAPGW